MNMRKAFVAARPLFRRAPQIPDHMNRNALAEGDGQQRQYALFVAIERDIRMPSVHHSREDASRPESQTGSGDCQRPMQGRRIKPFMKLLFNTFARSHESIPLRQSLAKGLELAHAFCREAAKVPHAR